MDPFALVLLAGFAALIFWLWLLGRHAQRTGLEQPGIRSAREISETREQLEAEDLDQMLAAHNARRRARGEPDVTVGELELLVMQDATEQKRRREELLAERELDELLAATNARRRARGLPERTRSDVQQEFGPGSTAGA